MAHSTVLRASVTADTLTTEGGPATVLVDGADTAVTANGLQGYTPTPGDRLLVGQVGRALEVLQFISTGSVPGIPDGSITDAKIALLGLNPQKGIVDMRPGAFTSLIHDWQFRDATFNALRFGASGPGITLVTVAEELAHAYSDTDQTTMGAVGAAPPVEYVAGPKTTLLNVVNDTTNFAGKNVVPVQCTSGLVPGDVIVSAKINVGGRIGIAPWSGIGTIYLNMDPATQNAALVAGNGVNAKTRIEWLAADGTTVIYTQDGLADTDAGSIGGGYFGHYDWITMNANNFDPAVIGAGVTPTYIRVSVVWEGDTITAETGSQYALELPGFNIWNVGGTAYQPGTPIVKMDHNQANTEVTLLSGLPVTPADTYTLQGRALVWNTTTPYVGTFTGFPQGGPAYGGDLTLRVHLSDGTYTDHYVGSDGHNREGDGWSRETLNVTMPDNAVSIDVLMQSWNYLDPNDQNPVADSTTYYALPRLTISGWHSWAWGQGARISDSLLEYLDWQGKATFQHDVELGTKMQGGLTIGPQQTLNDNVPIDCSAGIWAGKNGVGTWSSSDSGVPIKVGLMLHPSYNGLDNAPFSMGYDGLSDGSGDACMVVSADTQTSGVKAPKGFVGIAKGDHPSTGATAQTTGFIFDSDANTITPVGSLSASGRITGEVIMWPGPVLPANWLECDGTAYDGVTAYAALHDAISTTLQVNTSFTAGTVTFTPSDTSLLNQINVGDPIASVCIGGTNIATVTAKTSTTFTISGTTSFGGPASFVVYPFGVATYGIGFRTFKVPDWRDKFPRGASSTVRPGATGGSFSHTLSTAEMPSHTHGVGTLAATDAGHQHNAVTPDGTLSAGSTGAGHTHGVPLEYVTNTSTGGTATRVADINNTTGGGGTNVTADTNSTGSSHTHNVSGHTATGTASISLSGSTASAGSGSAIDITNPYQAIRFIIYAA